MIMPEPTIPIIAYDGTKSNPRAYNCGMCSKSFKRSEHCARHQRAHTQEKPYSCKYCHRRYSRKDLVVRHERTLHAKEQALSKHNSSRRQGSQPALSDQGSNVRDFESIEVDDVDTIVAARQFRSSLPKEVPTPSLTSRQFQPDVQHQSACVQDNEIVSDSEQADSSGVSEQQSLQLPQQGQAVRHSDIEQGTQEHFELGFESYNANPGELADMENSEFAVSNLPNLDFFDPFLGNTFEQFQLPNLQDSMTHFSPLEQMSQQTRVDGSDKASESDIHVSQPTELEGAVMTMEVNDITYSSHPQLIWSSNAVSPPTSQLPQVVKPPATKHPPIAFNDAMRTAMLADISSRVGFAQMNNFRLPGTSALQKCLRTYEDAFHIHVPILHLQSLDFMLTPSPLVLALCAIGALYRLERRIAANLYIKAVQALSNEYVDPITNLTAEKLVQCWENPYKISTKAERPLWVSQARLLLAFFSAFSGDPPIVRKSLEELGYLANDNRIRLPSVKVGKNVERTDWNTWIERESVKRLLLGTVFFSNLITITYGIPPGFSIVQDGAIELPDDEVLWNAPTADQWQCYVATRAATSPRSLRDAVYALIHGSKGDEVFESSWAWSPFSTAMIMHAVSIQVWHSIDGNVLLSKSENSRALSNMESTALANHIEAAINRCRCVLTQARSENDNLWTESEGPLLFNAFAVLRVAYGRAFTGIRLADRTLLLRDDECAVLAAIAEYIALPQERGEFTTKAISRTFEGLVIPFRTGAPLVRKTAALTWSVEHALAGWDSALLVTKWVHAMELLSERGDEMTSAEQAVLTEVFTLLEELDSPPLEHTSAASELARMWAGFYDDTWVWGVTPRIGWILRQLGNAYEAARKTGPLLQ